MNIAVIPARGGSKRIPSKNIRPFAGRPIIAYSVAAALESGIFDHVVVSTDDEAIAEVAKECGAEVPFMRPAELAGDLAGIMVVMRHALDWAEKAFGAVDHACCLCATAPFLRPEHLRDSLRILRESAECEFVFPVTSFASSIFRSFQVKENGDIEMFWPENEKKHTQDFPEAYHDAGMFYLGTPRSFRERGGFFTARSLPLLLPRHLVHDLDTEEDWERAELVFTALGGSDPAHGNG